MSVSAFNYSRRVVLIVMLDLLPSMDWAQPIVEGADRPIDAPPKWSQLKRWCSRYRRSTYFPTWQQGAQKLAAGAYKSITSSQAFARAVTDHLQQVTHGHWGGQHCYQSETPPTDHPHSAATTA